MRAALIALSLVVLSGPALAQSQPAETRPPVQVGIPGCADDRPVRATRELVHFDSRGRSIRAHLYSPRGEANGSGVVLLHGGTGFEMNSILFDAHAIQLASRGYRVILPAYFDAAPADSQRRTVAGRAWRQVALDAAEALAAEPGMSIGRVALWGYSRGAGVALSAATTDPRIRSAILVAGGGDVDESLSERDVSFLVLHARRDEAVPARATIALAGALREAGADVDLRELPFDGHQYDLPTWCEVFAGTRAFIDLRRGD